MAGGERGIRMYRSSKGAEALVAAVLLSSCTVFDGLSARPDTPGGPPGDPPCVGGECPGDDGTRSPTPQDGVKDGTETDVDCGGSSGKTCADGQGCKVGADCTSSVCVNEVCKAPAGDDGVKNGDETDVDCGGANAPRCAVAKTCKVHADCASDGCDYTGHCAETRSCTGHAGGDTCGPGEMDDPNRQHESCCREIALPSGASLDKYTITAGRMRAFLERVNNNPREWIEANKPAWWGDYPTSRLPTDLDGVVTELSHLETEGYSPAGCFITNTGARTYYFPPDVNARIGDEPQRYAQEVYDSKALNCVRRVMAAALCAFDGKQLASRAEYLEAWGDKRYPWGDAEWTPDHVIHNYGYYWPAPLAGHENEQVYHIAAPGRRPLGNGPFGHSDLAGNLYAVLWVDSIVTGSFERHAITQSNNPWTERHKYWAGGFRCSRAVR